MSRQSDRYPRTEVRPFAQWSVTRRIVALSVLAAMIVAAWSVAVRFNDREVQWAELGFTDQTDSSIMGSFRVTTQPDTSVRCTVRALNAKKSIVGVADVDIPANGQRERISYVKVDTSERAVTVVVDECDAL